MGKGLLGIGVTLFSVKNSLVDSTKGSKNKYIIKRRDN